PSDDTRQREGGSKIRHQPDAHERKAKARATRGYHEICTQAHAKTCPIGHAVHCSDDGLWQFQQTTGARNDRRHALTALFCSHLYAALRRDITATAEVSPFSCKNQGLGARVCRHHGNGLQQFVAHDQVDRITSLRPIKRDSSDAFGDAVLQRLEGSVVFVLCHSLSVLIEVQRWRPSAGAPRYQAEPW